MYQVQNLLFCDVFVCLFLILTLSGSLNQHFSAESNTGSCACAEQSDGLREAAQSVRLLLPGKMMWYPQEKKAVPAEGFERMAILSLESQVNKAASLERLKLERKIIFKTQYA